MLVIMTVDTQQLPVAPVGRVIVMVVVFVMDRQFTQSLALKFTAAAGTDPGENLECLFAIALHALLAAGAGLSDHSLHPLTIQAIFLFCHMLTCLIITRLMDKLKLSEPI
jgi:hypothetical protein